MVRGEYVQRLPETKAAKQVISKPVPFPKVGAGKGDLFLKKGGLVRKVHVLENLASLVRAENDIVQ